MNVDADLSTLRDLYAARDSSNQKEGEIWVANVSEVLNRVAPPRAAEFDQLTPYLFAGLSTQLIRPTWHKIGSILRAAISDLERGEQTHTGGDGAADPRKVFVVHGRDERLRGDLFSFLRALKLEPLEFSEAIRDTGKAAPYIGEILDSAFRQVQAVVVLLSPDDEVKLAQPLWADDESEVERTTQLQARPNVLFEAGLAFGTHADRTILVEIGHVKAFSDVVGRHVIRLDNSAKKRNDLAERLALAGCPIDKGGSDWLTAGDFAVADRGTQRSLNTENAKRAADIEVRMGFLGVWSREQIVLENIGEGVATDIVITADGAPIEQHPCYVSGQTTPTMLRPGEELGVKIALAMGSPERADIQVEWHDEDGKGRSVERAVQLL